MVHVGSLAVSGPRAKLGNLKFCSPLQTRDINLTKVIDTQRWHLTTKSINLLGGGGGLCTHRLYSPNPPHFFCIVIDLICLHSIYKRGKQDESCVATYLFLSKYIPTDRSI